METINLHQPGNVDVTLDFPSEWNELTGAEVIDICKQLMVHPDKPAVARANIILFIIEHRAGAAKVKLPKGWQQLLNHEQAVADGFPLLDFVYEKNTLTKVAEDYLTLPSPKGEGKEGPFYGPAQAFEDMTCGEFEDADVMLNRCYDDMQTEHLARMAAILWRPLASASVVGHKTQQRQPYTILKNNGEAEMYDFEKEVPRFMQLEPWRLYAVFAWLVGCKSLLPLMFPTAHEKHGEPKDDKPDPMAFTKCIHAGAGVKNGSRNQIRVTKLLEFFFEMEQEAIKAKELKAMYDKQKG